MAITHEIDGVTYVEVDRKAKIGDLVTYVYNDRRDFVARVVEDVDAEGIVSFDENPYLDRDDEEVSGFGDGGYRVLEPLETVDETQASPQVLDMLANLARRVTSLERQLADTQRNLERQAEELENAKHRISKHATMFGAVEEKFEMLTDDVITLDERSQVLNAINKYYAEGRR